MPPIDLGLTLEFSKLLVIPITVLILGILFRPLLRGLFKQVVGLESKALKLELKVGEDEAKCEGPESIISETQRKIAEGLKEESKEKLERLRLALETEQVNQLIQYHANSLAQSKISFWFSIVAGTLGFLIIVLGAVLAFMGFEPSMTIISVVSGAIIDAVAALFFAQSNQARRLMTEFFDRLRSDRRFNESLRLCESIPSKTTKSTLKAQLSLFFAGIPADAVFGKDLKAASASAKVDTHPKE